MSYLKKDRVVSLHIILRKDKDTGKYALYPGPPYDGHYVTGGSCQAVELGTMTQLVEWYAKAALRQIHEGVQGSPYR